MQKKRYTGWIVGGIIVLLVIYAAVVYNSLVKKEEKVKKQWSEVQNTYQRRLDLIPNLVNVVQGLSDFEKGSLVKVSEARASAQAGRTDVINAENYQQQARLQDSLAAAANRLIVVIEKYPTLKGTAAYSGLQTQLQGTERRIKVARNDFNEAVAEYNQSLRSAGTSLFGRLFGFKVKEGFQADAGTDKSIEIKF